MPKDGWDERDVARDNSFFMLHYTVLGLLGGGRGEISLTGAGMMALKHAIK